MASGVVSHIGESVAVSKPTAVSRGAYVTFLAGDGDYVKGVVGLAKGLRKIKFAMAYYVINYSKLRIWDFVEYQKMVYLDADIQVFDNIDHLFDLPGGQFYAVMDCFCEKTWSFSKQYEIGYCQQCPDRRPWPSTKFGEPPALYFNAGFFVFEPNAATCESLLSTLQITPPTSFAEQDFLNMYFKHIYKPIPLDYNLVMAMLWRHPEKVDLEKVKVVHYCAAGSKPWRFTGEEENMDRSDIKMLVKKWWEIYEDDSLDFNRTKMTMAVASAEGSTPVAVDVKKPYMAALSKAGTARFVKAPSAA
ncbi:hypothetical protein HPP92_012779 [Vanilla planifolia]|uniref:Hexosyltransferase n=1 Tax=Vanilla planifolia TaxID=51239 RepID=A0A835QWU3_VANPL|nr:hypothetical protein HPP92_012779 [Vanilla planifolia]